MPLNSISRAVSTAPGQGAAAAPPQPGWAQRREAREQAAQRAIGMIWARAGEEMWAALAERLPRSGAAFNESGEKAEGASEGGHGGEGAGPGRGGSNEPALSPDLSFSREKGLPDWVSAQRAEHWMLRALDAEIALDAAEPLVDRGTPFGQSLASDSPLLGLSASSAGVPHGAILGAGCLAAGILGVELSRLHRGQGVTARAWAIWSLLETEDMLSALGEEEVFGETGVLGGAVNSRAAAAQAAKVALQTWASAKKAAERVEEERAMSAMGDDGDGDDLWNCPQEAADIRRETQKSLDSLRLGQLFHWGRAESLWREAIARAERDEIAACAFKGGADKDGAPGQGDCARPEGAGGSESGSAEGRGRRRL